MRFDLTDVENRVPGSDTANQHDRKKYKDEILDLHVYRIGTDNESAVC